MITPQDKKEIKKYLDLLEQQLKAKESQAITDIISYLKKNVAPSYGSLPNSLNNFVSGVEL